MSQTLSNSKLNPEQVLSIYDRCLCTSLPYRVIAAEFQVTACVVRNIATQHNHAHLTTALPKCDADNRQRVPRRPPARPTCTMTAAKAQEVRRRTQLGQSTRKIAKDLRITRHIVRSVQLNRSWRAASGRISETALN